MATGKEADRGNGRQNAASVLKDLEALLRLVSWMRPTLLREVLTLLIFGCSNARVVSTPLTSGSSIPRLPDLQVGW